MRYIPLLLVSSALLTGCGASNVSADNPSTSPPTTATAAPSTTPAAPEAPAHETAKHFIRRWVRVNTDAQRTGDLTALDALNEPGCESCTSFRKLVKGIYNAGGTVEVSDTTVLSIEKRLDGNYYARERSTPSRYKKSATSGWTKLSGGTTTVIYTLAKVGPSWSMADYAGLAGSTE